MGSESHIDWGLVHQQLADAEASLDRDFRLAEQSAEAVLERRASLLASRHTRSLPGSADVHVVLIEAAGKLMALPADAVSQVVSIPSWTPVPDAHESLLGIINVQNDLVALLSPWAFSVGTPGESSDFKKAVVLAHPVLRLAVGCDEVPGLVRLSHDQIKEDRLFEWQGGLGVMLDANEVLQPLYQDLSA
jgi:chemotaxis signal transduction protein